MCESCKNQRATVHLTDIGKIPTDRKELHLCEACARQKGIPMKAQVTIQSLVATIAAGQAGREMTERLSKISCDACGMTYPEFREKGRLGCPRDYEAFEKPLLEFIERVHGADRHIGKAPSRAGRPAVQDHEMVRVKMELGRAIEREEYEKAAALRDQLKHLEEPGGTV